MNLQHAEAPSCLLVARTAPTFFWCKNDGVGFHLIESVALDQLGPRACLLMSKRLKVTMLRQLCSQVIVTVILQYQILGERENVTST